MHIINNRRENDKESRKLSIVLLKLPREGSVTDYI
jgi:hypothetical protein